MKKITNKLFEPYRFPRFWCILLSIQFAIISVAGFSEVGFILWGYIAFGAAGIWVEDLEAGRHKPKRKTIITVLILISSILLCIGRMNSKDTETIITVSFIIELVIQIIFLIATIWERKRYK